MFKHIIFLSLILSTLGQGVTQDKVWRVPSGGTLPSWGAVNLAGTGNGVTGTLPVTKGGTGAATLTANGILMGNGTSAISIVPGLIYNSLQGQLNMRSTTATGAGGFTIGPNSGSSNDIILNNKENNAIIMYTNQNEVLRLLTPTAGDAASGIQIGAGPIIGLNTNISGGTNILQLHGNGTKFGFQLAGTLTNGHGPFFVNYAGQGVANNSVSTIGIANGSIGDGSMLPVVVGSYGTAGGSQVGSPVLVYGRVTTGGNTVTFARGFAYNSSAGGGFAKYDFTNTMGFAPTCTCTAVNTVAPITFICNIVSISTTQVQIMTMNSSTLVQANADANLICIGERTASF